MSTSRGRDAGCEQDDDRAGAEALAEVTAALEPRGREVQNGSITVALRRS